MSGTVAYVSDEDHAKLVALLEQRRRMVKRHAKRKREMSRQFLSMAEKTSVLRAQREELAELNQRIDNLIKRPKGGDAP